jgi:hypothetical protein
MAIDVLTSAVALAFRAACASRGETITYIRGERSVSVTAIRGQSEFQCEAAGEVRTEYTDADWKVLAEDMVFPVIEAEGEDPEIPALAIVPQKGDRVAAATETFEVLAPAGAKVFSQRNGKMRIHSKQVSA